MIAYFTASVVGKRHYQSIYLKIIEILQSYKIEVISDHIIKSTESQIRLESEQERLAFQKKLEEWLTKCNFVVAETSFPSISVGFEISLALQLGKPVLILYSEKPPSLLAHHENEKLVCEQYTPDTLKGTIDDFLKYIEGTQDSRFTFFLTSRLGAYLDKISQKRKIPKSVYLRRLIEKDMEKLS